jgi:very-short-patch-repair endonuclease
MADAEKLLWRILRSKQLGAKFRKQHPIGNYIADFASLRPKLVIELDGGHHGNAANIARDEKRTRFLEQQGFRILRFWNNYMEENPEDVFQIICAVIEEIKHSQSPHPNPPPVGEGISQERMA